MGFAVKFSVSYSTKKAYLMLNKISEVIISRRGQGHCILSRTCLLRLTKENMSPFLMLVLRTGSVTKNMYATFVKQQHYRKQKFL